MIPHRRPNIYAQPIERTLQQRGCRIIQKKPWVIITPDGHKHVCRIEAQLALLNLEVMKKWPKLPPRS